MGEPDSDTSADTSTDTSTGLDAGLDADVIVVGAGPVGLTAALKLARAGVRVVVLEAGERLAAQSRASTFHPSTLAVLDELGVARELIATGLVAPVYQYRKRGGGVVAELDLAALAEETAFPYRVQNEQNNLTRIIAERLAGFACARIVYGARVDRVETGQDRVGVFVNRDGDGDGGGFAPDRTARWVIAADGASSAVRRSAGIAFDGVTFPERFLVASTTDPLEEALPGLAYVSYVADPEQWGVLLRTPRHWRVLVPVPEDEPDDAAVAPERVRERMRALVPLPGGREHDPVHTSLYAVHQRVASTFAHGRVLLAGDAAHVNNPLGGLGMNSGVHDADAAADAVLAALAGADPDRCAEAYTRVRRTEALRVVQRASQRNFDRMRERDEAAIRAHDTRLAALAADPAATRAHLRDTTLLTSLATSRATLRRLLGAAGAVREPAGRRLGALVAAGPVVAPGCHDALSALVAGEQGHRAVYVSGAAVSAALLGLPDRGHLGLADLAAQVARITAVTDLPVVADIDTGFGNEDQVAATVSALERAGAAAVQLEDQVFPKRCGHLPGKQVVPAEDMVAKLRAALAARTDLLVIARTDALSVLGADAAVDRARRYARAGADLVFVEGATDAATLRRVRLATGATPLVVSRSEAGEHDAVLPPPGSLADSGVGLVIQPVSALLAATAALRAAYAATALEHGPLDVARTPWTDLTTLVEPSTAKEQRR